MNICIPWISINSVTKAIISLFCPSISLFVHLYVRLGFQSVCLSVSQPICLAISCLSLHFSTILRLFISQSICHSIWCSSSSSDYKQSVSFQGCKFFRLSLNSGLFIGKVQKKKVIFRLFFRLFRLFLGISGFSLMSHLHLCHLKQVSILQLVHIFRLSFYLWVSQQVSEYAIGDPYLGWTWLEVKCLLEKDQTPSPPTEEKKEKEKKIWNEIKRKRLSVAPRSGW